MNSLKRNRGVGMKPRKWKAGRWLVLACALTLIFETAAAQETRKPGEPVPQTEPDGKSASPTATAPDSSRVDNKTYVIGENDVLDIDVWKEKELTRSIPVRPDGKISLPLIGEIQAS